VCLPSLLDLAQSIATVGNVNGAVFTYTKTVKIETVASNKLFSDSKWLTTSSTTNNSSHLKGLTQASKGTSGPSQRQGKLTVLSGKKLVTLFEKAGYQIVPGEGIGAFSHEATCLHAEKETIGV
jgi:hypothetical protein